MRVEAERGCCRNRLHSSGNSTIYALLLATFGKDSSRGPALFAGAQVGRAKGSAGPGGHGGVTPSSVSFTLQSISPRSTTVSALSGTTSWNLDSLSCVYSRAA